MIWYVYCSLFIGFHLPVGFIYNHRISVHLVDRKWCTRVDDQRGGCGSRYHHRNLHKAYRLIAQEPMVSVLLLFLIILLGRRLKRSLSHLLMNLSQSTNFGAVDTKDIPYPIVDSTFFWAYLTLAIPDFRCLISFWGWYPECWLSSSSLCLKDALRHLIFISYAANKQSAREQQASGLQAWLSNGWTSLRYIKVWNKIPAFVKIKDIWLETGNGNSSSIRRLEACPIVCSKIEHI